VGPHVDNYDVFLLQGRGKRKWAVSTSPIPPDQEEIVEGIDVRVLKGPFTKDAEWVLEPGDMLYVPARFAHWGVSMDDECMTYSIGFRAPNLQDIASEYANHMCDNQNPDLFYTDPSSFRSQQGDAGLINEQAVKRMWSDVAHTMLGCALDTPPPPHFTRWLGGYLTQNLQRASSLHHSARSCDAEEAEMIMADLAEGRELSLTRSEGTKVAWLRLANGLAVCADGQVWELDASAPDSLRGLQEGAAVLCGCHILTAERLNPLLSTSSPFRSIVQDWIVKGVVYCPSEDDDDEDEQSMWDEQRM